MNKITQNFLHGLFSGLNDQNSYRLGLWINGFLIALAGATIGGAANLIMQVAASPGPIRWGIAAEWAKGAVVPAVLAYFAKSPIEKIFTESDVHRIAEIGMEVPQGATSEDVVAILVTEKEQALASSKKR